jgi:hypothetical protein
MLGRRKVRGEEALSEKNGIPPMHAANPALAIEHATDEIVALVITQTGSVHDIPPTSAWQPPSAAEMVLPRLKSIPIACFQVKPIHKRSLA